MRAEGRHAALSARRPWITAASATAQWKARSARRYPPPTHRLRGSKSRSRLTNGSGQNIIAQIRGSRRRVADIKSESRPASNRNRWPASYWKAWPTSSESASIDTFKKEWPEVGKAPLSVISMIVVSVVATLGVAVYLNNAVLAGKDATIENLKSRIDTLEADKADLEKKLAAIPVKPVDEEKQRHHQELIAKIPDLIEEGREIAQTYLARDDTDLIMTQYQAWEKKVLGLLSELGSAYSEPFKSAAGPARMLGGHNNMKGNSVFFLLGDKLGALNSFLGEMRR